MTPDVINGLFEGVGGILLWKNVARLYEEKMVRGMHWQVTAFFFVWGLWNLFYYPSLGQWWSFVGGINIALANSVWIALALRYRNN